MGRAHKLICGNLVCSSCILCVFRSLLNEQNAPVCEKYFSFAVSDEKIMFQKIHKKHTCSCGYSETRLFFEILKQHRTNRIIFTHWCMRCFDTLNTKYF